MMKKGLILIATMAYAMLMSCGARTMPAQEFVKRAQDRHGGYCIARTDMRYDFELYYRPWRYFAAQALCFDSTSSIEQIRQTYNRAYYFMLKLSSLDSLNIEQELFLKDPFHKTEAAQLLFTMGNYVTFLPSGTNDTIPCMQATIEQNWGMHNDMAMLLVFARTDTTPRGDFPKGIIRIRDFGLKTATLDFDLGEIKNRAYTLTAG